jgi:hypothetical protein
LQVNENKIVIQICWEEILEESALSCLKFMNINAIILDFHGSEAVSRSTWIFVQQSLLVKSHDLTNAHFYLSLWRGQRK